MNITFNQLPEAVGQLHAKLDEIGALLLKVSKSIQYQPETDQVVTIKEAAAFLNLSVSTLYGLVNRKQVPVYKRNKRLYFSKQELLDWIKKGRKKTAAEISADADAYLNQLTYNGRRQAA